MGLWTRVMRLLLEWGVKSVHVPRRLPVEFPPQGLAVALLVRRLGLCRGSRQGRTLGMWEGVELLVGVGPEQSTHVADKECPFEFAEYAEELLPRTPRIVVDLSLWHEHTETEKHELVEQVISTLRAVREYYWDAHLYLTNVSEEFLTFMSIHAAGMRHRANLSAGFPPLDGRTIMLDPAGPLRATEEYIRSVDNFVIGGIVDKERSSPGATARLAERLGIDERARLDLRGSVVGVPDRINKVSEIVLRVIEGEDLEHAILSAMSRRDKWHRMLRDVQKAKASTLEEAAELVSWLNPDDKLMRKLAGVLKPRGDPRGTRPTGRR